MMQSSDQNECEVNIPAYYLRHRGIVTAHDYVKSRKDYSSIPLASSFGVENASACCRKDGWAAAGG
jgi:hypothetical protein